MLLSFNTLSRTLFSTERRSERRPKGLASITGPEDTMFDMVAAPVMAMDVWGSWMESQN
jgi:hypothetical protein